MLAPSVLKFRIDWVPPTLNRVVRMHWTKQRRLTATAAVHIAAAIGRPHVHEHRPVRVRITMHRPRVLDQDRAFGACTCLFDAIRRLGWAHDDAPQWMNMEVAPIVIEHGDSWTEIEIERC